MAFYHPLKDYPGEKQRWIATRLLALRADLAAQITDNRRSGSLIIGSWNIRAFDGGRYRLDESYHYIAEIIDKFDICAVQEVKADLGPLRRLVKLLGPSWDYFVSDVTGGAAGNTERMAYLYNKDKVRFRNLIGELVIPKQSIARTPYFASFQAHWFRFTLCSAHITFGADELRQLEISAIAKTLVKRSKQEDEVYVFLGDMNIDTPESNTMLALTKNGMTTPLFGKTNTAKVAKHYDQMAFTSEGVNTDLLRHGTFDWRSAVFRDADLDHYESVAIEQRGKAFSNWARSYASWCTFEMSDHLPIWIEIKVDYSDRYLRDNFAG